MSLIVVYALIVVIGEAIVVAIGLTLDRISAAVSMPVSLALGFIILGVGWKLAVRLTEPKHTPNAS